VTISDAFAVTTPAAAVPSKPKAAPNAQAHARMRARASVPSVTGRFNIMWADLRSCWWMPASLPTVAQAWRERVPDLSRVPAENLVLHRAWVIHNHTVGLAVPVVAIGVVGLLTPLVWVARHPARLILTLALLTPLVATTVAIIHT
jgi:hypothetical protein